MKEFRYDIVRNPEIFQENRLAAHSDHPYFKKKNAAYDDLYIQIQPKWNMEVCLC